MRIITIKPTDPASAEAARLIDQLDSYLAALYPAESNHLLSIEALQKPGVTFFIATVDGAAAGCGAFVRCVGYAEVKRMYVARSFRGLKLGRRILDELASCIPAAG